VCYIKSGKPEWCQSVFLVMDTATVINEHPKMCSCQVELSYYCLYNVPSVCVQSCEVLTDFTGMWYFQLLICNSPCRVRRELRNQSPYFEQTLYVASVMEERPPGTLVTTVKARDPENSPVSYSMSSLLDSRSQGEMLIKNETLVGL
jgi:hypothetical protein